MSNLHISVPHNLGQEESLRRVKAFIEQARSQFGEKANDVKETWDGNTCTFDVSSKGVSLAGTLIVSSDKIELKSKLPFAAMMFKKKIESALTDGIRAIVK